MKYTIKVEQLLLENAVSPENETKKSTVCNVNFEQSCLDNV